MPAEPADPRISLNYFSTIRAYLCVERGIIHGNLAYSGERTPVRTWTHSDALIVNLQALPIKSRMLEGFLTQEPQIGQILRQHVNVRL